MDRQTDREGGQTDRQTDIVQDIFARAEFFSQTQATLFDQPGDRSRCWALKTNLFVITNDLESEKNQILLQVFFLARKSVSKPL